MTDKKETDHAFRRKRVQVFKKLIILFISIMLLVPAVLCVIMFFRIQALESRIDLLTGLVYEIEDSMKPVQEQGSNDAAKGGEMKTEETALAVSGSVQPESAQDTGEEKPFSQEIPEDARKVYLTFDDGPGSQTGEILDILAQYDVKATFFVIGKEDEKSQEALRRIVEEGHTLGMHSYSHKYSEVYASVESFAEDMDRLREYLYEVTGVWSTVYRFPGGSSNTVSRQDMHDFIDYLNEQDIAYFDWNVSSGDASRVRLSADTIVENCTKDLKNHKTAVILMHDAADKKTTVEALPMILEKILAMEDTLILPITSETVPIQHITIKDETEE